VSTCNSLRITANTDDILVQWIPIRAVNIQGDRQARAIRQSRRGSEQRVRMEDIGGHEDDLVQRELFGGAILLGLPVRFTDVSDFRPVPDSQEVRCELMLSVPRHGTCSVARGCKLSDGFYMKSHSDIYQQNLKVYASAEVSYRCGGVGANVIRGWSYRFQEYKFRV
jgi:hypothetical protein